MKLGEIVVFLPMEIQCDLLSANSKSKTRQNDMYSVNPISLVHNAVHVKQVSLDFLTVFKT